MPNRSLVSKELAQLLSVLAHPHRIRIVEELRDKELDVNGLQSILGTTHSGVSQHLALLRTHRVVAERREGRHVYYRLSQPGIAVWLAQGIVFLEGSVLQASEMRGALEEARQLWTGEGGQG